MVKPSRRSLTEPLKRSDKTIIWLFPSRPVLTAFAVGPLRCNLDQPATTYQLLDTIKEMGAVAGMLDRAYAHALRLGAARDVAHLPSKVADGTGLLSENVRQSLGHTYATMHSGVTEEYVGGSSLELYNARAMALKEHKGREPRFVSMQGGEAGPEARGQTSKMLVEPTPLPASEQFRRPLKTKDANAPSATAIRQRINPATLEDEEIAQMAQDIPDAAVQELRARILLTGASSGEEEPMTTEDEVALDRFTAAQAQSVASGAAADDELEEEAAILFDDADSEAANESAAESEEFIARYSRCNIVNNYYPGRHCQRESTSDVSDDLVGEYCMVGGSRDHPQPMSHHCTKTPRCPFQS